MAAGCDVGRCRLRGRGRFAVRPSWSVHHEGGGNWWRLAKSSTASFMTTTRFNIQVAWICVIEDVEELTAFDEASFAFRCYQAHPQASATVKGSRIIEAVVDDVLLQPMDKVLDVVLRPRSSFPSSSPQAREAGQEKEPLPVRNKIDTRGRSAFIPPDPFNMASGSSHESGALAVVDQVKFCKRLKRWN